MGLFDLFGSREERERSSVRRLAKKLTEKYGPPENRQKAIEQLGDMGTPEALVALCQRFTILSDPGITDAEEKERTRSILVDAGADGAAAVREFVRREESGIAWGLRVLAALQPAQELNALVVEELARLSREYSRDPEKKLVLLTWLVEHRSENPPADVAAALLPLLEDFSDDVRICTVRALAALSPTEPVRDGLIQLLLRDKDNARVRGDVLEALARMGADVKGHRPSVEPLMAEPFYLDREGQVKKRG